MKVYVVVESYLQEYEEPTVAFLSEERANQYVREQGGVWGYTYRFVDVKIEDWVERDQQLGQPS